MDIEVNFVTRTSIGLVFYYFEEILHLDSRYNLGMTCRLCSSVSTSRIPPSITKKNSPFYCDIAKKSSIIPLSSGEKKTNEQAEFKIDRSSRFVD